MSNDDPDAGIIYILKNEAMPGYIKIGLTRDDDVEQRLRSLDNTSVPLPFTCYYSSRVPDCARLERTLHFVFGEKRARLRREFFQTDPDLVKAIIELVALGSSAEPTTTAEIVTDAALPSAELEAVAETVQARASRRTLGALGIPPGSVLRFSKNPDETCTVVDDRHVNYQGEVQSLSKAAMTAVRAMGYNWPTVSGTEYWTLDGRKLASLERSDVSSFSDSLRT